MAKKPPTQKHYLEQQKMLKTVILEIKSLRLEFERLNKALLDVGVSASIYKDQRASASVARIGTIIQTHRERLKWSQEELANRANTTQKTVSFLETGKIVKPRQKTLTRILEALNIPLANANIKPVHRTPTKKGS